MRILNDLPVFRSLKHWSVSDLSGDLSAGLTLAAIAIPEQMATASLGSFAPAIGLFAIIAGSIAFAVFGGLQRRTADGRAKRPPWVESRTNERKGDFLQRETLARLASNWLTAATGLTRGVTMTADPFGKSDITCILNGTAGSGKAREASGRLPELFARNGAQAKILLASNGNEITALARRAVEAGHTPLVVGGGDGTVNAVATELRGTESSLGVLPLGTLNHFAKDLKIPLALDAAVRNIFCGHVVRVDVGEVNGRTFLNNSCLGLYPTIVHEREGQQRKGHKKWLAFAEATYFAFRRYSPLYVGLQMSNQREMKEESPFVFVGNNRYQISGLRVGQREHLDAGRLWVYRAPRATRWELCLLALQALVGSRVVGELAITETEEFWISTASKRLNVATDGEVATLSTPLHYRIHSRALNVIVPTEANVKFQS